MPMSRPLSVDPRACVLNISILMRSHPPFFAQLLSQDLFLLLFLLTLNLGYLQYLSSRVPGSGYRGK